MPQPHLGYTWIPQQSARLSPPQAEVMRRALAMTMHTSSLCKRGRDRTGMHPASNEHPTTTPTSDVIASYVINIRYPFANQTEPPWANCLYTVQRITPGQGYANC